MSCVLVLLERGGAKSGATRSRETELETEQAGPDFSGADRELCFTVKRDDMQRPQSLPQSRYVGSIFVRVTVVGTELEVETASGQLGSERSWRGLSSNHTGGGHRQEPAGTAA